MYFSVCQENLLVFEIFFPCNAASHDSGELSIGYDIVAGVGSELTTFLAIQSMVVVKLARVAASMIIFMSLLSNMVSKRDFICK